MSEFTEAQVIERIAGATAALKDEHIKALLTQKTELETGFKTQAEAATAKHTEAVGGLKTEHGTALDALNTEKAKAEAALAEAATKLEGFAKVTESQKTIRDAMFKAIPEARQSLVAASFDDASAIAFMAANMGNLYVGKGLPDIDNSNPGGSGGEKKYGNNGEYNSLDDFAFHAPAAFMKWQTEQNKKT